MRNKITAHAQKGVKCPLNAILILLSLLALPVREYSSSFHFPVFYFVCYFVCHKGSRVLKTGYLKTLPVIICLSCFLSVDLYGAIEQKKDDNFDNFIENADGYASAIHWVDIRGQPVSVSSGSSRQLGQPARLVEKGRSLST